MVQTKTFKLLPLTLLLLTVFAIPRPLLAGETKTSPTMVYLGMSKEDNIEISDFLMGVAEKELRSNVQMRPYAIFDLLKSGSVEIDELMEQIAALEEKDNSEDQKKTSQDNPAEAGVEVQAKMIAGLPDKLQELKRAEFAYSLHLTKFKVDMEAGGQKATVELAAGMEIYKLNFSGTKPPSYELVISVVKVMPERVTGTLREKGALDQQMAPLVRKATDRVGKYLGMQLRKLPEFQAQATVSSGSSDMLVIPMGKNLGVELDDTFDIFRKDGSGKLQQVAWVKARKIEKEESKAEIILSDGDWSFRGDEIAVEDESSKVSLLASAVLETTTGDLLDRTGSGVYPGAELGVWVNLANSVGISEMHLTVSLDFMDLGRSKDPSIGVLLGHATIGLAKKWTFHRLALWFGMRAGFSYYLYSESSLMTQQDQDVAAAHIGFGGDALLGLELRLIKHLGLYAQLTGRIFSNPIDWLPSSHMEAGGGATAGLLVDF